MSGLSATTFVIAPVVAQAGKQPTAGTWVLIGAIAVGIVLLIVLINVVERRRVSRAVESLNSEGWRASRRTRAEAGDASAAWMSVPTGTGFKRGADGVRWCATRSTDAGVQWLMEHAYSVGSGKNRRTIVHTIATLAAPHSWPSVDLRPAGVFDKLVELFKGCDLQLEDGAFNSRWKVRSAHETFALTLLSPELQAELMSLAKNTRLCVGDGSIALMVRSSLSPQSASSLADTLASVRKLIPPELDAWGSVEPPA